MIRFFLQFFVAVENDDISIFLNAQNFLWHKLQTLWLIHCEIFAKQKRIHEIKRK